VVKKVSESYLDTHPGLLKKNNNDCMFFSIHFNIENFAGRYTTRGGERHVYKKVAVNATNSIKLHFLTNKVLDIVKKLLKIAKK